MLSVKALEILENKLFDNLWQIIDEKDSYDPDIFGELYAYASTELASISLKLKEEKEREKECSVVKE